MNKVLIADDHALVRQGLKQLIQEHMGQVRIEEASNSDEAIRMVRQDHWDILLLDISMPGMTGTEVLETVRALKPYLPVLMLSLYSEAEFGFHVLKTGKIGFVNKQAAFEKIMPAIQKALSGSN